MGHKTHKECAVSQSVSLSVLAHTHTRTRARMRRQRASGRSTPKICNGSGFVIVVVVVGDHGSYERSFGSTTTNTRR